MRFYTVVVNSEFLATSTAVFFAIKWYAAEYARRHDGTGTPQSPRLIAGAKIVDSPMLPRSSQSRRRLVQWLPPKSQPISRSISQKISRLISRKMSPPISQATTPCHMTNKALTYTRCQPYWSSFYPCSTVQYQWSLWPEMGWWYGQSSPASGCGRSPITTWPTWRSLTY